MKADPRKLIKAHYRTLRDQRTNKARWQDYAVFLGVPGFVAAIALIFGLELTGGVSTALLTTAGILSAFFFGVMLQVAERALEWADQPPQPGKDTDWQADFLREIAANAGYASVVSIVTAAVFVGALIAENSEVALTLLSAVGIALAIHLALMLFMVLSRIYALITDRLDGAKVGGLTGVVHPLPERKAGTGS